MRDLVEEWAETRVEATGLRNDTHILLELVQTRGLKNEDNSQEARDFAQDAQEQALAHRTDAATGLLTGPVPYDSELRVLPRQGANFVLLKV